MHPSLPIYIDADDVLSETGQALCGCVMTEFGRNVPFEAMHDFDLSVSFGLSPRELAHLFTVFHQDQYLLNLNPLPGARERVTAWHEAGWAIHIVTGRPAASRDLTLEWLQRQDIPYDELHIVDKYGREPARGEVLTLDQLAARSYAWAVEDSPRMAEFLSRRMNLPVYLLLRPWNRSVPATETINPVMGWKEMSHIQPSIHPSMDMDCPT
jgi:hypothetical protein